MGRVNVASLSASPHGIDLGPVGIVVGIQVPLLKFFQPGEDIQHCSNQLRIIGSAEGGRQEWHDVDCPFENFREFLFRHQSGNS